MTLPSLASIAASLLAVVLSVCLFFTTNSTQRLTHELQKEAQELQNQQQAVQTQQQIGQLQQQQVQQVQQLQQQTVPAVIADLRALAIKDKDGHIRDLLSKYNVSLEDKPADGAKPAAAPTPAP